ALRRLPRRGPLRRLLPPVRGDPAESGGTAGARPGGQARRLARTVRAPGAALGLAARPRLLLDVRGAGLRRPVDGERLGGAAAVAPLGQRAAGIARDPQADEEEGQQQRG